MHTSIPLTRRVSSGASTLPLSHDIAHFFAVSLLEPYHCKSGLDGLRRIALTNKSSLRHDCGLYVGTVHDAPFKAAARYLPQGRGSFDRQGIISGPVAPTISHTRYIFLRPEDHVDARRHL